MRLIATLLALLVPAQVVALSCLAPSVTRSFHHFNDAPEIYLIVEGQLTFDATKLPKNNFSSTPPPELTRIPGRLVGKSVTAAGFTVPFDNSVTLEVACFGPWCSGVQDHGDVVAFVKRDDDAYSVGINPCGGGVFSPETPDIENDLIRCLKGSRCPKD